MSLLKDEINELFKNKEIDVRAGIMFVDEAGEGYKNDGEALLQVILTANTESVITSKVVMIKLLYFSKYSKEESKLNMSLIAKDKQIKDFSKAILSLLSKKAITEEKAICKKKDGHMRKFNDHLVMFVSENIFIETKAVMKSYKKEIA
jgi:hypothetical protein